MKDDNGNLFWEDTEYEDQEKTEGMKWKFDNYQYTV